VTAPEAKELGGFSGEPTPTIFMVRIRLGRARLRLINVSPACRTRMQPIGTLARAEGSAQLLNGGSTE
jgi:hypothetical protein